MLFLLPDNLDVTSSRCTARESAVEGARAFLLDNGIFRLSVLPEFGGRVCSLFYRPYNLELLATEFRHHAQRKGLTIHGGWCAAFPSMLADGEIISHAPWDAEIVERSDARVVLRQWCLVDTVSHQVEGAVRATPCTVAVERFITLQAGESHLTVEDVLTNRNPWPLFTTWAASVSLRARGGDRVVAPVEAVEVQRGIGPSGNELDFGVLVSTPYQAFARDLREGWLGFQPVSAPVNMRLSFPVEVLPHAAIVAQRDERHPSGDAFRLQPVATPGPIADDTRGGALLLPPREAVRLPLRLEVGAGLISSGDWSRPGLHLAEMIGAQRVPIGRLAFWRVGRHALVVKTPNYLALLQPEFAEETLLTPDDLPAADLLLCGAPPAGDALPRVAARTVARILGPSAVRIGLLAGGVGEERSVALSPGARVDYPGLGVLATPARSGEAAEELGFLLLADNLSLYHAGVTQYLGEFGPIGEQFHPQLLCLPLDGMPLRDAVQAARQLKPRVVVPLGDEDAERAFDQRCREGHMPFAVSLVGAGEGRQFDGWHVQALRQEGE
ncbi:MAG TPA: hypothetical protein PK794_00535 [Armatimonadota bacterium]|nr:hypothetical protein [Armatimonadota bacterium]